MMKIIQKIAKKQSNLYAEKPVTIAFLGDSVTQGCFECYKTGESSLETVFDYGSAYSTRIKEIFSMLYPSVQINVINSGISGDCARGGLERLERDVLCYQPDLVVVSFGLNDTCGGKEKVAAYKADLAEIFRRVTESGTECIFMTQNMMNTKVSPHLEDGYFRSVGEYFAEVQNSGVLDAYFEGAKAAAKECGVAVCDCYAKWKALAAGGVDTTELLSNKFNHPLREMHYLFAYSLIETMFGTGDCTIL